MHAARQLPVRVAATVPVLALCGAIAVTSQPSVPTAAARAAASASSAASASISSAAFRPVADAQLPQTAAAGPSLPPLGVPAQILHTAAAPTGSSAAPATTATLVSDLASSGIPIVALNAYKSAARRVAQTDPSCGLSWPLLAGIGRVESNHGRFGGAQLRADGSSTKRIIGIPLNGHGTALIRDTDHGVLDGDTVYDRAVGPMQFIPSTWRSYASDGNGDGRADPFNIFDAALATARYLCVAGGNLTTAAGQQRAILTYNDSTAYLRLVLAMAHDYATGTPAVIPVLPATDGTSHPSGSSSSRHSGSSSAAGHSPASSSAPRSSSSAPNSSASSSRPSSSSPSSSGRTSSTSSSSSAPSSSGSSTSKPSSSCSAPPSSSSSSSPAPKATSSTSAAASGASLSASNQTSTSASSSDSPSSTASPSASPTSCGAAAK